MAFAAPPLTLASGWTWILPASRLARSPTVGAAASGALLAGSLAQAVAVAAAISTSPPTAKRPRGLTACPHQPAGLPAQVPASAPAPSQVQAPSQEQVVLTRRRRDRRCRPARSAPALRTRPN